MRRAGDPERAGSDRHQLEAIARLRARKTQLATFSPFVYSDASARPLVFSRIEGSFVKNHNIAALTVGGDIDGGPFSQATR